ncbi:MAG: PhaR: predicted polyhydroxyalkanoate synthesis repressor [Planctomycetota bacterium]|jgi:polyhydroxyalkanoate synthesis repressor PhaR
MILPASAHDVIRIRKYPNRRLYDTSRSTHLTHDEVLSIVRRGQRVQISDSRTEADITNEVLLQILIARAPELVAALPTGALLAVARGSAETVSAAAGAFSQAGDTVRPGASAESTPVQAAPVMASVRA